MNKVKMNRADVEEMFMENKKNETIKSLFILVGGLVVATVALALIPKMNEEA